MNVDYECEIHLEVLDLVWYQQWAWVVTSNDYKYDYKYDYEYDYEYDYKYDYKYCYKFGDSD